MNILNAECLFKWLLQLYHLLKQLMLALRDNDEDDGNDDTTDIIEPGTLLDSSHECA